MSKNDLIQEANNLFSSQLFSLFLSDIRNQIMLSHVAWGLAGEELSVGNTLQCNSWEKQ